MADFIRRVLLRADSGPGLGLGHAMRCLALAEELGRRQFMSWFASRSLYGAERRIHEQGYSRIHLSDPPALEVDEIRRQLAGDGAVDATRKLFRFLVFDHYMAEAEGWLRQARSLASRRLVFDDMPGRGLPCELLVNPALGIGPDDYAGYVAKGTRLLLGPRYAPLRPSLRHAVLAAPARTSDAVRTVVVGMGGATSEATALAVEAVQEALPDSSIDVVVGRNGGGSARAASRRVRVHVDPDDITLAGVLVAGDLALGAAGVSAYERCMAGLPSVAVELAPNQRSTIRGLANAGAAIDAGPLDELSLPGLVDLIRGIAADATVRASMRQRCRELVDGRGADRIAHELEGVRLRRPRLDDMGLLWAWSNDPETRLNSVSRDPIPWKAHQEWFTARADDPGTMLLIGYNSVGPVGQVRFDMNAEASEVSIATDPLHRGTVGSVLLRAALRRFKRAHGARRIMARVRTENTASRRLFESAGFTQARGEGNILRYVLEPPEKRTNRSGI